MDDEIEVVVKVPDAPEAPAVAPAVSEAVAVIAAAADVLDVKATEINIEHINGRITELNIRLDGLFDLVRNVATQNDAILAAQIASIQQEIKTQEKVADVETTLEETPIDAPAAPPPAAPEQEPEARKTKKRSFF